MTPVTGLPDFEPPRIGAQQPPAQQQAAAPPPAYQPVGPQPVPPRAAARRRRWLFALGTALVLVLALLVVVDRITPRIIGNQIGSTLQNALGTPQRPIVRFGGFPFLTQVATGHYRQVSMTAKEIPIAGTGQRLRIEELRANLTDVRTRPPFRTITIRRFAGSATMSYESLSNFIGTKMTYDGGAGGGHGYVALSLGHSIIVTGKPSIDPGTGELFLDRPEFRIDGRLLPNSLTGGLLNRLFRIPLPELFPGVVPTDVRAGRNGMTLTGEGRNIILRR